MIGVDRSSVLVGDCRDLLRSMPERSVQTCVTSPPYFGLRDYGHDGQIGLEPTPDEFVQALVGVFREVRRVLRDDGTVWLNLGDSYAVNGGARGYGSTDGATGRADAPGLPRRAPDGLKSKDLIGIPWMVAFALRADGWYLRSDIIWHKPNPMPESVTDRPTKAHEYLFLLSKGPRYFYDADAVRDAKDWGSRERSGPVYDGSAYPDRINGHTGLTDMQFAERGRNKRSVWTVATQPYSGAHFATFPPKLIEPCILAGTSPKACGVCGAPWRRIVERTPMVVEPGPKREAWRASDPRGSRTQIGGQMTQAPSSRTTGWEPSCEHDDDIGICTVLDPFTGAGTTGVVAGQLGRAFIGCELNPEYAEMARERIALEGRPGGKPATHEPTPLVDGQLGLLGEAA